MPFDSLTEGRELDATLDRSLHEKALKEELKKTIHYLSSRFHLPTYAAMAIHDNLLLLS